MELADSLNVTGLVSWQHVSVHTITVTSYRACFMSPVILAVVSLIFNTLAVVVFAPRVVAVTVRLTMSSPLVVAVWNTLG